MSTNKIKKIALVMDWDDTLCPDSIGALVNFLGYSPREFWEPLDALVHEGWDIVTAYMYGLKRIYEERGPLRGIMASFARTHEGYPGSFDLVERCQTYLKSQHGPIFELEPYILSSGLRPLITNNPISTPYKMIWGSDFHEDAGACFFPKVVLNFSDKLRCITQIHKGLSHAAPLAVSDIVEAHRRPIPYERMIYIGDGYTDIPCFSKIKSKGGQSYAVVPEDRPEGWKKAEQFLMDQRVHAIGPANYTNDSKTWNWICTALDKATQL
jgi:hypothetical protein